MFFKYDIELDSITARQLTSHRIEAILRTRNKNYKAILTIRLTNKDYDRLLNENNSCSIFDDYEKHQAKLAEVKDILLKNDMLMFTSNVLNFELIEFTNGKNTRIIEKSLPYKDRYFFTFKDKNVFHLVSEDRGTSKERRMNDFKNIIFEEVKKESREKTYISF